MVCLLATYAVDVSSSRRVKLSVHHPNGPGTLVVDPKIGVDELLKGIKAQLNFSVDVDLVAVESRVLNADQSVDEYLASIPVGTPLNVCKRDDWIVSGRDDRLVRSCYIQGVSLGSPDDTAAVFDLNLIE